MIQQKLKRKIQYTAGGNQNRLQEAAYKENQEKYQTLKPKPVAWAIRTGFSNQRIFLRCY